MSSRSFVSMQQNKNRKRFKNVNSMNELLKQNTKPTNFLEIENMVMNDMRKKILYDEMNEMKFYDIQQIEAAKTHNNTNFRSTNFFGDMSMIRGTKFHQKLKRTDLEQKLREKIQEEPGFLLLLREIYEKLEENKDFNKKQSHMFKDNKLLQENVRLETDQVLVTTLDAWQKYMKQQKLLTKQHNQQMERDEEEQYNQKRRSIDFHLKAVSSTPSSTRIIHVQQPPLAFPQLGRKVLDENEGDQDKKRKNSIFKQKILSSLSKMTVNQMKEMTESDRSVNKTVVKYLNQGEGLTRKDFVRLDQKQVINMNDIVSDYTLEGLKKSLHTLIKMSISNFTNAYDRAQFYEKQSNKIVQSVNDKIKYQEQEGKKKNTTLNILRKENHEIHDKSRQIKLLLHQLNEELKQVSQSQKEQKLLNKVQGQIGGNINRSSNIDNLMSIMTKQNDIEQDINVLKDSQTGFNKKLLYNNDTIDTLENEILKLQKNNKSLTKSIQGFFLELLLLGLDCRNSGLCWIIQSLWDTGERVTESSLPTFLDVKCKEFLFLKAKRIIELKDMVLKSHDHFEHYKTQINYHQPQENNSILSINFDQPSILQSPSVVSYSTFTNSFAMINSHQIKALKVQNMRLKQSSDIEHLLEGVTTLEKKFIDQTMNDINSSKMTLNDLVYKEAQNKVGRQIRASKSHTDFAFGVQQTTSDVNESIPNEVLQELKERLIKEWNDIQSAIKDKQQQLVRLEDLELLRMIKEIDFKNYLQRFNADPLQVLATLFGYHRAEREIIKNGMMRKQ